MTLRRVDWIFVAGAIAVVAGVSLLPAPKDRNPMIPETADHRSVAIEKGCVQCHQADGVKPVPARHPKRQDCFRCHTRVDSKSRGVQRIAQAKRALFVPKLEAIRSS